MKVKRALISVTDKTGLVPFAQGLAALGMELVSTGGTLKLLKENGVKAKAIDELTGFPEILGGRLKTLHPKVHGGLLMLRENPEQVKEAQAHGIEPIDLVVVNLYKFEQAAAKAGAKEEEIIENIDIGGPTMLRSASKNFEYVGVVSDPADYPMVLEELKRAGELSRKTKMKLAGKVFTLTAAYDRAISAFFERMNQNGEFPESLSFSFKKYETLRYGENPHQRAALYTREGEAHVPFKQLQGKELSFNNLLDIESALDVVAEFSSPAAVVIKHNNPCGVAEAAQLAAALGDAIACDEQSAFGGIVAVNRALDGQAAQVLFDRLAFFEVLIAPAFDPEAVKLFSARKNLRMIETDVSAPAARLAFKFTRAGLLAQDADVSLRGQEATIKRALKCVTKVEPSAAELDALIFAWKCAKQVKSNAIVLVQGTKTVGVGAGQMSRVDSVRIACEKAGVKTKGAVLASDGFFPMPDSVELAHQHGVRFIIQPGGSIKDADVIRTADALGLGMVLTGQRHFRH